MLSIIIPVYNVEGYLDRCIDSVVNQTSRDWEAILVDDGSTDNSGLICDKWSVQYEQIKVIHQKNKGLSGARNAGIDLAQGEYILLLDSDDYLDTGAVMKITDYINANNPDILFGKAFVVDDSGKTREKVKYQFAEKLYTREEYLNVLSRSDGNVSFCAQFGIYSKKFLSESRLRFCEGLIHEDELWTPCVLLKAERVFFMDCFFYYHYVRAGSIMHSGNLEKSAINTINVCEMLKKVYSNYPKQKIKYLHDRLSMLFLRAVPDYPDKKYVVHQFGRMFPLMNASSLKNVLKAILFFLSPEVYCVVSRITRGYEACNILNCQKHHQ